MIRKLIESDRDALLKYLYVEGSLNIFIIGDVEAFGFSEDFQTLYGEFDEDGNYIAVLLFYRENTIFYSHDREFNTDWLKIYKQHKFSYMSGVKDLVDKLIPYFDGFKIQPMYFAEAVKLEEDVIKHDYEIIEAKTVEDFTKLFNLLITIDEFGVKKQSLEDFVDSKVKALNMGTVLLIEEEGIVISTVATTAETTKNAMVVGVATLESARKRGLASILMKELMKEYFDKKNKYLCLFYDNPKAGNIYKRLGFKDVDKWVMLSKE